VTLKSGRRVQARVIGFRRASWYAPAEREVVGAATLDERDAVLRRARSCPWLAQ
jgi:hypothetical protein